MTAQTTGLTSERLEQRRAGIGGSDIAAVLGFSPYKTPLDVYREKLGLAEPDDLAGNDAVHFGNVLEDVVADEFGRRTGLKPRRNNRLLAHKDHPHLLANIDRDVIGKPFGLRCGLECKTADKWAARPELWGNGAEFEWRGDELRIAEYDEQVPDWYLVQCAHYMAVTNSHLWFLAVLIGGNDFRIYTIQRNERLEAMLLRRAGEFWNNHVIPQVPPPPSSVVDLETLYAKDSGAAVEATPEILEVWAKTKELQAQGKAIDMALDGQTLGRLKVGGLKNQLRAFMGEHSEIIVGEDGKPIATWKATKDRKVFDTDAFKATHPDLHKQFTKTVPGSRVLLIK